MPKYLFQGSYTAQGVKGVLKEGGTKRREAVVTLAKSLGGKLDAFYFAFGGDDFFIVVDLPTAIDAAAISMIVNASGAVSAKTTVLLTVEEVDAATQKSADYRPPGE